MIPSILIVGAGASGLTCALTLAHINAQNGTDMRIRIIEKRPERSTMGKATGIAQGVWTQLQQMGIHHILPDAQAMQHFAFFDNERTVAKLRVPLVNQQAPAKMYPQALLEEELETALNQLGIFVQYGAKLISFSQDNGHIFANIDGNSETFDWLIGADGAHSFVRTTLNVPFVGRDYPEKWSVAQIETQDWPEYLQAQLYLQSNGVGLFMSHPRPHLVQAILNAPNAAERLLAHFPNATLDYERQFNVSLRRVKTPRVGKVWLIGDAAHTQSPVGGQGLNLAIWDGIALAQGLLANDMTIEKRLAKRAKRTLLFTHFDYIMLASPHFIVQALRNTFWRVAVRVPIISRAFFKAISGVW